jgi:hypothetical protein
VLWWIPNDDTAVDYVYIGFSFLHLDSRTIMQFL